MPKGYKYEPYNKTFSRADSLKKHMQTVHDGNKDHKCVSCEKKFTVLGALKKHTYIVHEGHRD